MNGLIRLFESISGGSLLHQAIGAVVGFVVLFALFALLETIFPEDAAQPRWRRGSLLDTAWWFGGYVTRGLAAVVTVAAIVVIARFVPHPNIPAISQQPGWLQFAEVLVITDFVAYWIHRGMHRIPSLWPIHAVHHSIEDLDWLAAARVHPLDTIIHRPLEVLPVFMLGFSSLHVLPLYALFIAVYPIFIHANVSWDYGSLRLLIASPAFHRWHHTAETDGIDKNYAALFPFLDLIFGTLYFPKRASTTYGLGFGQRMKLSMLSQLAHPFTRAAITTDRATP